MSRLRILPRATPHFGWPGEHPQYVRVDGTPDLEYFAFVPEGVQPGSTPLVLVHGISRNAIEMILRFADQARALNVPLIAPLFRREAFGLYQQLVDPARTRRADLALFDILADAAERWSLDVSRFWLFGFSGGAQFAHRLAFFHPDRVRACVPASAGWYCWPDEAVQWPLGLGNAPLSLAKFHECEPVPMHVIVGRRDNKADDALRQSPEIDALQGPNRVERSRRWHRAMLRAGHPCTLTVLPRTRHSFDQGHKRGLVQLTYSLLGFPAEIPRGMS